MPCGWETQTTGICGRGQWLSESYVVSRDWVLDVESELHVEGVAQQVQTPSKPVTPLFMRVPEFGTVPVPA